jgi:hypothetical protein
MRALVTLALVGLLVAVVALCPAFACLAPAAHPCCPHHKAPAAAQDCPSLALEKGKLAAPLSFAAPVAAAAVPALRIESAAPAPVNPSHPENILLLVRVLRI